MGGVTWCKYIYIRTIILVKVMLSLMVCLLHKCFFVIQGDYLVSSQTVIAGIHYLLTLLGNRKLKYIYFYISSTQEALRKQTSSGSISSLRMDGKGKKESLGKGWVGIRVSLCPRMTDASKPRTAIQGDGFMVLQSPAREVKSFPSTTLFQSDPPRSRQANASVSKTQKNLTPS